MQHHLKIFLIALFFNKRYVLLPGAAAGTHKSLFAYGNSHSGNLPQNSSRSACCRCASKRAH